MKSLGITDYLLIKLVDVVASLPLGLYVDGMILNTFSCGHDWLSTRKTKRRYLHKTKIQQQPREGQTVPE